MTTGNTTLLGLALPVDGELDGTWGDVVNDSITSLVDSAIAGTTTLSTDADVTLTTTALAANQARQAILLWTASNGATTRYITAPAQSKPYIVINAGTGSVVLRGAGPTTGVTIVAGEKCLAAWNSSDFVKIATTVADGVTSVGGTGTVNGITLTGTVTSTGNLTLGGALSNVSLTSQVTGTLPVANGGTGVTTSTGTGNVVLSTSPTLVTPALGTPTAAVLTNATGLPISSGVAGLGTGVASALAFNVGNAGGPVVNGGALGTPSSGTLTNATGLPISTGVSGLGTGVATFLATPSSANLASAVTDETGTGALVFATSPTLAGTPLAPTAAVNTNTTQIATTAFVQTQIGAIAAGVSSFSAGTTGLTPATGTTGAVTLAGTLAATNGGTGQSSYAVGDLVYASTTTALSKLPDVATGNALISGGVGVAPSYGKIGLTTHVSGVLDATNGGTGQSSYAVGDLVYASTTTALSKLPDVATGNALISGGVGVAPSYGKIGLTTHVSGTLPVANGGTNLTSYTVGDIVYASGATTLASLADVATGNALISGGVGTAPSYGKIGLTTHVSGTLPVANGGTGQTSYTDGQLLIGNSTGNTLTKATLTAGANVTITNSAGGITIAATTGGGTVTSVTGTAPVSVATGTTTPVISLASGYGDTQNPYASKTANYVLAAPNGAAGVPTFRAIVAADIPTLNQNTTGTAAGLSATLAVASGGTGVTTSTGTGSVVLSTSPTLVTPALGTPTSGTLTSCTGLPVSTGISGLGTGVATALAVNVGSAGAPVVNGGALGTPSSGTVTNLTGTASININGTVGATTPTTGAFTTLTASTAINSTRINSRVSSTTSAASITPDVSAYDMYALTAQAATLTINAPIGTPLDGNKLIFRILDNGTSRTLTWNATYTAIGVTIPTATTASKILYVGCIYNAANTRWDVISITTQV